MKTKTFFLTTLVFILLLFCSNSTQGQTTKPKLDQIKLMKHFLGTWQRTLGKDTIELWESKLYGTAIITNVSLDIKGKKSPSSIINDGFDDRDGKLKGFSLKPNTDFETWIGEFTSEDHLIGTGLDSFNPDKVLYKFEFVFINPNEFTGTTYNKDGGNKREYKFTKVK
jgi:hypothetical protein